MPMNWTDQADVKMLLAIITSANAKVDYKAIAEYMGSECTPKAIQHRMQRLREKAKAADSLPADDGKDTDANDDGTANSSAPVSPEKRKRGRAKKSSDAATPVTLGDENEDPDMAGMQGSPTKKAKGKPRGRPKKAAVKKEEEEKDDDDMLDALVKKEEGDTDAELDGY
ncbi:hypothetical protein BDW74DRAFT_124279 [Aspergillus multicolor]|uniref:uncharacterized protein n=1 Tax=Aspergillus multicolor TaxID=41759 RepID=UPI003CCE363C